MAEAEIIQLGSRGRAGRGSRSAPSAAARGLSGSARPRPASRRSADGSGSTEPDGSARGGRVEADLPEADAAQESADVRTPFIEDALRDDRRSEEHGLGGPSLEDRGAPGSDGADPRSTRPRRRPARTQGPARSTYPSADDLRDDHVDDDHDEPGAADRAADGQPVDDLGPGAGEDASHGAGGTRRGRPDPAVGGLLSGLAEAAGAGIGVLKQMPIERVRRFAVDPLRGLMALAEAVGVDWEGNVDEVAEFARSRLSGDYAVDEFGFDPEFTTKVFLPILRPLVQHWFRVEVQGIENIPTSGAALLVSNHAGTMPLDGMVLHSVVHDEIGRHVRMLGADLIFATPFSHDLARRIGTTLACQEDAESLLDRGELVSVFPEGFKGLGKPYRDRYKLQRFGRGGFVSAAVRAQVPIIPISVVGSEEIYPLIASAPTLARALGAPYFPITPLFPWLGLLGAIPLPSKWIIQCGEAIATDELPPGAADDPMVVFNVTDQVRETIQHSLYALLMQRPHAFR